MDRICCNQLFQVTEGGVLYTYCFGASRIHIFDHNAHQFMSITYDFEHGESSSTVTMKKPKFYKHIPREPEFEKDSDSDADLRNSNSELGNERTNQVNIDDIVVNETGKADAIEPNDINQSSGIGSSVMGSSVSGKTIE